MRNFQAVKIEENAKAWLVLAGGKSVHLLFLAINLLEILKLNHRYVRCSLSGAVIVVPFQRRKIEPAHVILVLIVNIHAGTSSEVRCLIFDRSLHLLPHVVYASREGSVESVYMRSLARAFVAH